MTHSLLVYKRDHIVSDEIWTSPINSLSLQKILETANHPLYVLKSPIMALHRHAQSADAHSAQEIWRTLNWAALAIPLPIADRPAVAVTVAIPGLTPLLVARGPGPTLRPRELEARVVGILPEELTGGRRVVVDPAVGRARDVAAAAPVELDAALPTLPELPVRRVDVANAEAGRDTASVAAGFLVVVGTNPVDGFR